MQYAHYITFKNTKRNVVSLHIPYYTSTAVSLFRENHHHITYHAQKKEEKKSDNNIN